MISSSIRCVLVGAQVDCTTKQSMPRTFSTISTCTSPSLKVPTCDLAELDVQVARHRLRELRVRVAGEDLQLLHGWPRRRAGSAGWLGREDSNLHMAAPKAAALPVWRRPRIGRPSRPRTLHSDPERRSVRLPSFRRLRDPGPDRRGEGGPGQRAGAPARRPGRSRRAWARCPRGRPPAPPAPAAARAAGRSPGTGARPPARGRCARSRPSARVEGRRPSGRSGGRRRPRTRPRSRAERPGSRAGRRAAANSASGSDPLADPGDPRGPRGQEEGHVRAEAQGEAGRAPARRARPGSCAASARSTAPASLEPPPSPAAAGIRFVSADLARARASPPRARKAVRGAHREIARVRGHAGAPRPRARASPAGAGRLRDLELDLVGQVEGREDALELVIAVRATAEDAQAEIELCRREDVNARAAAPARASRRGARPHLETST